MCSNDPLFVSGAFFLTFRLSTRVKGAASSSSSITCKSDRTNEDGDAVSEGESDTLLHNNDLANLVTLFN